VKIPRTASKPNITHPSKPIYNCLQAEYMCDLILEVQNSLFLTARRILISKSQYFSSMLKESSGWNEITKTSETIKGIPILKLESEFDASIFNIWHTSFFYNQCNLTTKNCGDVIDRAGWATIESACAVTAPRGRLRFSSFLSVTLAGFFDHEKNAHIQP